MVELQQIDREECLALLAATRFGRLAVDVPGQAPLIRPVNYLFDERSNSVVFRTAHGSKRHRLLASRHASLEIDGLDQQARTGWSVIVRGVAQPITDSFEIRRLERAPLDPWAPGEKPYLMRLRVQAVSGRQIVDPDPSVVSRRRATDISG